MYFKYREWKEEEPGLVDTSKIGDQLRTIVKSKIYNGLTESDLEISKRAHALFSTLLKIGGPN